MSQRFVPVLGLLAAAAGFGYWWHETGAGTAPLESETTEPAADVAVEPTEPAASAPGRLELNLKVGDRFPMIKTVAQTLTQMTAEGPATSHSTLQLTLAIHVEEVAADGRTRLGVQYDRVRFTRDIAGDTFDFDSQTPAQADLPPEVRLYRGLVGNGFSFWVGADHRIAELVGFRDFLQRCVRDVPESERQALLRTLGETTGEDGIANFVDDSIGLLPAAPEAIAVGQTWQKDRQLTRPLPIRLATACTLAELSDRRAEIDIAGTIAPLSPDEPLAPSAGTVHVQVRGGRTMGHCTIDRTTGLPLESRVEHAIDMLVRPAVGEPFAQRKHILTTVQAFPQQDAPVPLAAQTLGN